ncbi:MAG: hypothetical protein ACI3ZR_00085 [bacterium]
MIWETVKAVTPTGVKTKTGFKRAIGNKRFKVGDRVLTANGFVIGHEPYRNNTCLVSVDEDYIIDCNYKSKDGKSYYLELKAIPLDLKNNKIRTFANDELKVADIFGFDFNDFGRYQHLYGYFCYKNEIVFVIKDGEEVVFRELKNGKINTKLSINIGDMEAYNLRGWYSENGLLHCYFITSEIKYNNYRYTDFTVYIINDKEYSVKNFSTLTIYNKILAKNGFDTTSGTDYSHPYFYDTDEECLIVGLCNYVASKNETVCIAGIDVNLSEKYYCDYVVKLQANNCDVIYKSQKIRREPFSEEKILKSNGYPDEEECKKLASQEDHGRPASEVCNSLGWEGQGYNNYINNVNARTITLEEVAEMQKHPYSHGGLIENSETLNWRYISVNNYSVEWGYSHSLSYDFIGYFDFCHDPWGGNYYNVKTQGKRRVNSFSADGFWMCNINRGELLCVAKKGDFLVHYANYDVSGGYNSSYSISACINYLKSKLDPFLPDKKIAYGYAYQNYRLEVGAYLRETEEIIYKEEKFKLTTLVCGWKEWNAFREKFKVCKIIDGPEKEIKENTGRFVMRQQFRESYKIDYTFSPSIDIGSLKYDSAKYKNYLLPECDEYDNGPFFYDICSKKKNNYCLKNGIVTNLNNKKSCHLSSQNIGFSTIKNIKKIMGGKVNEN